MIVRRRVDFGASGLSRLIKDYLPGGASRLAAWLLPQILPVFSVVAPGHPGAALRNPVLVQPRQATRALPRCGGACRRGRGRQLERKRGSPTYAVALGKRTTAVALGRGPH